MQQLQEVCGLLSTSLPATDTGVFEKLMNEIEKSLISDTDNLKLSAEQIYQHTYLFLEDNELRAGVDPDDSRDIVPHDDHHYFRLCYVVRSKLGEVERTTVMSDEQDELERALGWSTGAS